MDEDTYMHLKEDSVSNGILYVICLSLLSLFMLWSALLVLIIILMPQSVLLMFEFVHHSRVVLQLTSML